MKHLKKPWDYNPSLTEDKINAIGNLIHHTRMEGLESHDSDKGDGKLGHGIKCYERTCYALTRFSDECDYLEIIDKSGNKFLGAISGVSFKFKRDTHREKFKRDKYEQNGSLFDQQTTGKMDCWRFLIECEELETTRILFVGVNSQNEIICEHEVSLAAKPFDNQSGEHEGIEQPSAIEGIDFAESHNQIQIKKH